MRRGLMAWDAAELPIETIQERQTKLRAAMQMQQLDAFIAYTNIAHPAAVSWISGFTPYWSEGLYYLPLSGEPAFATALSKRVAEWIGTVMPIGEIIPTPTPGQAIGKLLAAANAKRIGIVDLDDIPARQPQALIKEATGIELIDASDLFNAIRCDVDDAERALVTKAALIAANAMNAADWKASSVQELIAPCEVHARKSAAEDIFLSVAPDLTATARFQRTDTAQILGQNFALKMSLAYKGAWVRNTRSYSRDPELLAKYDKARLAFENLQLSDMSESKIRSTLESAGAKLIHWSIEQPRGSSPLVTVEATGLPSRRLNANAPCTVNIECDIGSQRWLAARPLS